MDSTNWVQSIASVLTAIVGLFVLYQIKLTKDQIQQAKEQLRDSVKWNKLSSTFTFFQSDQILERERAAMRVCTKHGIDLTTSANPMTQEQLEAIRRDEEAFWELRHFLNFIEDYCTAVRSGVLDDETSYSMMSGLVIRYATIFSPFLEMRRKELDDEEAHIELLKLADAWKKRSDERRNELKIQRERLQKSIDESAGVSRQY